MLLCVQLEKLVLRFQTHAYHMALVIVHQRKSTIEALAEDLVQRPDATVSGERLNEALQQEPDTVDDSVMDSLPFKHLIPDTVSSLLNTLICSICCCSGIVCTLCVWYSSCSTRVCTCRQIRAS